MQNINFGGMSRGYKECILSIIEYTLELQTELSAYECLCITIARISETWIHSNDYNDKANLQK